jgi:hypothetical protein
MNWIFRWLRHLKWAIEDAIVDVIDALTPVAKKRYPPAPPTPAPPGVPFYYAGVSFSRVSPESVDAEFTRSILQRLASRQIFDIGHS